MSDYKLEGVIRLKDETSRAVKSADSNVSKFEKTLGVAKAALTAFGIVTAAKAAIALGKLGAQAERTERGFQTISGGTANATDNLNAMMRATNGAIDRTTAMGLANQMMQMGLVDSAESLGKNAEMATRLGAAMGVDATTAMQNWNAMMANQSLPRLDTYGISSGKVRTRINELTTSVEGMTREQAFSIAVMEQGQIAMDRLGESVDDNALSVEQSQAAYADLKSEIGMNLASAIGSTHTLVGKFTRQWGDNLRATRESDGEISIIRSNLGMLGDVLGFNNTVFDQYKEKQDAAAFSTKFATTMAAGYNARLELSKTVTLDLGDTVGDSQTIFEQYTQAIEGNIQANEDYYSAQKESNEAAAEAETAFLNAASALDEMSEAALARNQLDLLKQSLDAGTISQDQYRDATRAVLTEFGLLTLAEESAQGALDSLRQMYIGGKISAEQYATAIGAIKRNVDSLSDKQINIRVKTTYENVGGGSSGYVDPGTGSGHATGGYSLGDNAFVGEAGPELVRMPAGSQVYTAQETRNIAYNFNLNATYQQGSSLQDDVKTLAMLYGGGYAA